MLEFFSRIFGAKKPAQFIYECSIVDCGRSTCKPFDPDPRLRWLTDTELRDEEGNFVKVILCPPHAKTVLSLDEDFYIRTENAEKVVRATWV